MYAIGNVVLGTIRPWSSPDGDRGFDRICTVLDIEAKRALPDEWTEDDARRYAANPDDPALHESCLDYFNGEDDPWSVLYHGGAHIAPAYVGVIVHTFDETDHFPLSVLTDIRPTSEQTADARARYDALPERVRAVLPPFGLYILWSSS